MEVKTTEAPDKLLRGTFVTVKNNKSLIVSGQTIQAKKLFKYLGKAEINDAKKLLNNPG